MAENQYCATGRRKESTAQVTLVSGTGKITINGKDIAEYFGREVSRMHVKEPFQLTETLDKFDITARVRGGGITGQAGALRHGIARALLEADASLRPMLKKAGLLTRDPRMTERKKYGQRGARARFQFSKR